MSVHEIGDHDTITMVIADADTLAREGLKSMLDINGRFRIVGEACAKDSLLGTVRKKRPQLVIIESNLLRTIGMRVISELHEVSLETKVMLMGTTMEPDTIIRALQMGAGGYIPKSAPPERFSEACSQVARGDTPVLPDMAGDLLLYVLQQKGSVRHAKEDRPLTRRQYEVLHYMVKGYCNKEIAATLNVSETTVKSHVTGILRKLGVSDRTQAVLKAINEKILDSAGHEGRSS